MRVKNKRSGRTFDVTKDEYENIIVGKGLSFKYEIIQDDVPLEIKRMRSEQAVEKKKKETIK